MVTFPLNSGIKVLLLHYQMIVSRVLSGKYWYIGIINGTVRFSISGGGDYILTQGSAINDNQWHYVTATRNGTTGVSKIYVDGSLKGTTVIPLTVDLASATSKLEIGSMLNNYRLQGSLDELAIHNVELSIAEIQQHYANGLINLGLL